VQSMMIFGTRTVGRQEGEFRLEKFPLLQSSSSLLARGGRKIKQKKKRDIAACASPAFGAGAPLASGKRCREQIEMAFLVRIAEGQAWFRWGKSPFSSRPSPTAPGEAKRKKNWASLAAWLRRSAGKKKDKRERKEGAQPIPFSLSRWQATLHRNF